MGAKKKKDGWGLKEDLIMRGIIRHFMLHSAQRGSFKNCRCTQVGVFGVLILNWTVFSFDHVAKYSIVNLAQGKV